MAIGRLLNVCGLIGTIESASSCGCKIGPPADKAYAVVPVGVETIMPSDLWVWTNLSLMDTSSSINLTPLFITTSFNAKDS